MIRYHIKHDEGSHSDQLTLRYFVRSYVTIATTINAIADMPPNIPRPIGSTCRVFPGIEIGAADAAAPTGEAAAESDVDEEDAA